MKKILLFILSGFMIFNLFTQWIIASEQQNEELDLEMMTMSFDNIMNSAVDIVIYGESSEERDYLFNHISDILYSYNEVSDYLNPLDVDSVFLENIYTINQKPETDIEIDELLYRMLEEALYITEMTNGYFEVSIGRVIEAWKEVINQYQYQQIPNDVFDSLLDLVDSIDVISDPFMIWEENDSYYIRIKEGVKLDVGAIAKGYAIQRVYEYIFDQGYTYFFVFAHASSIGLGKQYTREDEMFRIGLENPLSSRLVEPFYGRIWVSNNGVTTSGNYIQYAEHNGLRYHHIISPFTKKPAHYYHTVTIIGSDLARLDAVSTALFLMDPDTFDTWMETNQTELDIEVIRFNTDPSISVFLNDTQYEQFMSFEEEENQIPMIIFVLGGALIVLSIALVLKFTVFK